MLCIYNLGRMAPTVQEPEIILQDEMMRRIGAFVGIFFTGALLAFGTSCMFLLSSKKENSFRYRDRVLRIYIVILLLVVIAFELEAFTLSNDSSLFLSLPRKKVTKITGQLNTAYGLTVVAIGGLTDGVLVWRCFMVQRALRCNPSTWGNVFWIFPACLWVLTIVTGSTTGALSNPNQPIFPDKLGATAIASNTTLNLYATLFITIRLLLHRRMVIACLGDRIPTTQHLFIVRILLESAAVNVPAAIAVAIGIGEGNLFGTVIEPVAAASQALASVIIIHQVALGRALSEQREIEVDKLMRMRVDNLPQSPRSTA